MPGGRFLLKKRDKFVITGQRTKDCPPRKRRFRRGSDGRPWLAPEVGAAVRVIAGETEPLPLTRGLTGSDSFGRRSSGSPW
jgi:hypothetical protein